MEESEADSPTVRASKAREVRIQKKRNTGAVDRTMVENVSKISLEETKNDLRFADLTRSDIQNYYAEYIQVETETLFNAWLIGYKITTGLNKNLVQLSMSRNPPQGRPYS